MIKSSKILLALFILIFLGASFFGYKFFKNRNQKINTVETIQNSAPEFSAEQQKTEASPEIQTNNPTTDSTTDSSDENTPDESNNFNDVSKADCENSCKKFTIPTELKYCQEICGIGAIRKDIKEKKGCDALKDLNKDYCLKDLAINTKNIALCNEISDTDIKKVCKNRIAQDMIESQKL